MGWGGGSALGVFSVSCPSNINSSSSGKMTLDDQECRGAGSDCTTSTKSTRITNCVGDCDASETFRPVV